MEFHIPYFQVKKSPPPEDSNSELPTKPKRDYKSLSFLGMDNIDGILEAQMSFTMCGFDESHWVAYAFDDADPDNGEWEDRDFSYEGFIEDPIALWELEANRPIWNPRQYFLLVMQSRITRVLKNWKSIVGPIRQSINSYVSATVLVIAL
jgi:hypothetical protein